MFLGFVSFSAPAQATTFCTGEVVVDVTQHITNDPDSGTFGGYWALDNFDRHIQIFQDGANYCAQADDNGSFTTAGASDKKSPQSGADLLQNITGTMVGGTYGTITGGTFSTSTPLENSIDCAVTPDICSNGLTSHWVQTYFPGGIYNYDNNWGWTYTSSLGEAWVNAAAGNTGDIHAFVNTTSHTGYATLQAAIDAASAGDSIAIGGNFTTSSQVNITSPLTLDGNGFTLTAAFAKTNNSNNSGIGIIGTHDVNIQDLSVDGTGGTNLHGINIYLSTVVNLDNVSVSHVRTGVLVNGSTVTVNNITTVANAWGGINVDLGSGVTDPAVLTVNGVSHHTETGADIWLDDITKDVSVVDTNSQYTYSDNGNFRVYSLKTVLDNNAPEVIITDPNEPVSVVIADGTQEASLDFSALVTGGTGTLPQVTIDSDDADVSIPASTVVTSADPNWDGVIAAPTVTNTYTITPDAGNTASVSLAIEVGSNVALSFDKAVRLTLAGQAGKLVGWSRGGTFIPITETCSPDDSQSTGDTLPPDGNCKIDVGGDLVIWTKHFTTFIAYTQTPTPVSSRGSSSRSGDRNRNVVSTGSVGEVLGAATVSPEIQAQIDALKAQIAILIQELIKQLQAQLAAALLGAR